MRTVIDEVRQRQRRFASGSGGSPAAAEVRQRQRRFASGSGGSPAAAEVRSAAAKPWDEGDRKV
ncbi:hypothetical protein NSQ55_08135 [Paenibacillus sp. FSL H7-0943]|uniref:hypothetical protein n=1 Tax=Paenibacillus sp. FSL H7-0943 TaxID=2954739 RepID=UPI0030CD3C1D